MANEQEFMLRIAVLVFMAAMVLIGMLTKRPQTLRGYALANRSLSTGVLTLTFLATFIGNGNLVNPGWVAQNGIVELLVPACFIIMFFVVGTFVVPKMVRFRGCITLGDVMKQVYGRQSITVFTGLVSLCVCVVYIGIEINAIGVLAEVVLGINRTEAIIIIGSAVVLYSAVGGMRAVAVTDVVQFVTLLVALVLLVNELLYQVGGLKVLFSKLPAEKLTIWQNEKLFSKMKSGAFWGLFSTFLISPPIIQRILMAKNNRQAKSMFYAGGFVYAVVRVFLVLLGLGAILYYNGHQGGEVPKDVYVHLMKDLFATSPLLQAVLLLGFLSILISTIDSCLLAAGVVALRDVWEPLFGKIRGGRKQMRWARSLLVLTGLLAIGISLCSPDSFGYTLSYAAVIITALFLVPFLLPVFGLKVDHRSFWVFTISYATAYGVLFAVVKWMKEMPFLYTGLPYDIFFLSFVVGLLACLIHHYSLHGRFVTVKYYENGMVEQPWQPSLHRLGRDCSQLLSLPFRLPKAAQQQVRKYGSNPFLFSLFIVFTSSLMTIAGEPDTARMFTFMAKLNMISVLLCVGLLLRSLWGSALFKYFDLYWLLTVLYCVPFVNVLLFLNSPNNTMAVVQLTFMLLLLVVLLDWRSFLLLGGIGAVAAVVFYRIFWGQWAPALTFETKWALVRGTFPAVVAGLFFAGRRETQVYRRQRQLWHASKKQAKALQVERSVSHQLMSALDQRSGMMLELRRNLGLLQAKGGNRAAIHRIQHISTYLSELKMGSKAYLPLDLTEVSMQQLIRGVATDMRARALAGISITKFYCSHKRYRVVCDIYYLHRLITNAIEHQVRYHYGTERIYCYIEDATLDHGAPGIRRYTPAYRITITNHPNHKRFEVYPFSLSRPIFLQDQKHLEENHRIAIAHYGVMVFEGGEGTNCCQTYVLPCDLSSVRPGVGVFFDEDLKSVLIDNPEDVAFLALFLKTGMDMDRIKNALRRCKHYHRQKKRLSGAPCYLHPVSVATILHDYTQDEDVIIAGLLHDVMDGVVYGLQEMRFEFGDKVAGIVDQITQVSDAKRRGIKLAKSKAFARMVARGGQEVLLVEVANRLDDMRTLFNISSLKKRQQVAEETARFFLPIAQQLGLEKIEKELIERINLVRASVK